MIRALIGVLLLLACLAAAPADAQVRGTIQISITQFANQFPAPSGSAFSPPAISETALVVFESSGQGSPTDTNEATDVYLRRLEADETELISATPDGNAGDNRSGWPAINSEGRYVAFQSLATDLVERDENGTQDVFVRDRDAETTELVSVGFDGSPANGPSSQPSISADGRKVAFCSRASNLAEGDANGVPDAFVRDLDAGVTTLLAPEGVADGEGCGRVAMGDDGRFVAFSYQVALGQPPQVFRYNGDTGEIEQLTTGDGASGSVALAIGRDGRFVAFQSDATDLVAEDTNGFSDVFLWDQENTTRITRVSVARDGAQGNSHSGTMGVEMSGDGRFMVFSSTASNLVPGDSNRSMDIFRLDRQSGQTAFVSTGFNDNVGNSASYSPDVSDNGSAVTFVSTSTNLVQSDRNRHADVFMRGTTFLDNGGGEEAPPVDAETDPLAPVVAEDDGEVPVAVYGGIAAAVLVVLLGGFLFLGRRGRA